MVILITADKGLCGALNTNSSGTPRNWISATTVFVTRAEGRADVARRGGSWSRSCLRRRADLCRGRAITAFGRDCFSSNRVDQVTMVAHPFHQHAGPSSRFGDDPPAGRSRGAAGARVEAGSPAAAGDIPGDTVFEPSAHRVLSYLPGSMSASISLPAVEAQAASRAPDGGHEERDRQRQQMLKDLSLEYNKLRQAAITNELLEITTAKARVGSHPDYIIQHL